MYILLDPPSSVPKHASSNEGAIRVYALQHASSRRKEGEGGGGGQGTQAADAKTKQTTGRRSEILISQCTAEGPRTRKGSQGGGRMFTGRVVWWGGGGGKDVHLPGCQLISELLPLSSSKGAMRAFSNGHSPLQLVDPALQQSLQHTKACYSAKQAKLTCCI